MPEIQVVTGPPFSGKGRYVRDEIERREGEGELGLVALDFTALYTALVPGVQSSFRDEAVSDTGARRMVAYVFQAVAAAIKLRELSGYISTQSPRQALRLADGLAEHTPARLMGRAPGGGLVEISADVGDIAERAGYHLTKMGRVVPRALAAAAVADCRKAALTYLREAPALVGRAREVRRSGRGWKVGEVKRPFDRALWEKGLTPRGKEALNELRELGNAEPSPSDVMAFLLRNRTAEG